MPQSTAIADREGSWGSVRVTARRYQGGEPIGNATVRTDRSTRTCREPQLELALRPAGQVQHHDAVGGPVIQHDRSRSTLRRVVVGPPARPDLASVWFLSVSSSTWVLASQTAPLSAAGFQTRPRVLNG